jgi:hypothetical protein
MLADIAATLAAFVEVQRHGHDQAAAQVHIRRRRVLRQPVDFREVLVGNLDKQAWRRRSGRKVAG